MSYDESLIEVDAAGGSLLGVLTRPAAPSQTQAVGVVIVVGGPQTRVGSHRQFVLLARALATAGYPCLRFDYSGMGDSPGPKPDFEAAGPDIRRACDALLAAEPGCSRVALWGLCDGATAALFHAVSDRRVAAVIAANPWVRSDSTRAAALVREHYGSRLRSPRFWKRLLRGDVNVFAAAKEAIGHALLAQRADEPSSRESDGLPQRVARAVRSVNAVLRFQLSGNDLTAAEFQVAMNRAGVLLNGDPTVLRLDDADHTFSAPAAWSAVIRDTLAVLGRIDKSDREMSPVRRMCES